VAYDDLRDWIKALDKAGELKRVREEVDPILEIAEITDRASKAGRKGGVKGYAPGGPALLFENGLPDLPALLVEPHRNPGGIWRIKFSYETNEPLSMSAVQATTMAAALHEIGEAELADEIDDALKTAARYSSM